MNTFLSVRPFTSGILFKKTSLVRSETIAKQLCSRPSASTFEIKLSKPYFYCIEGHGFIFHLPIRIDASCDLAAARGFLGWVNKEAQNNPQGFAILYRAPAERIKRAPSATTGEEVISSGRA